MSTVTAASRRFCSFGNIAIFAAAFIVPAAAANAAIYNYFDTTFNNADWVGSKHADTTPSSAATFVSGQFNPGGSFIPPVTPDYRQTTHTYSAGAIVVSHQAITLNWSPLPGEFAVDVDYQYDLEYFVGAFGGAVGYAPAIFQGGNVYRPAQDAIFLRDWTRFTGANIPIAAFLEISPVTGLTIPFSSPNPNLGFGFGYISSNSANALATKTSGLDNYGITLKTNVIPEPSSLALGIPAFGLLARRRR